MLMVQKSGIHQFEVRSLSHYLQDFMHPTGGCLGFLPSTVRKGIHLESYSGDGIGTFNPILGTGLDS